MEYNKPIHDMSFGEEVEGFYLIKDAKVRTASTGKSYLTGTVSDRSGSIEIKLWDYTGPIGPGDIGTVIKLRGTVSDFKGLPQLLLSRIRYAVESDHYELSALIPTAPIDVPARLAEIEVLISSIEDSDYRSLAQTMYERHKDGFARIPAAKSVHHGFLSGLLMHTSNMLRTADFLSSLYSGVLDRSLLLTGTLLHDIAKLEEFSFSEFGLVSEYSRKGQLLGHLYMGAQEISALADELAIPEEKSLLLQHMLLSHHGEPEFGAAVRPLCAEAELLYLIDSIDSRMEIYEENLAELSPGQFSQRIFALEKRIYRHE